MFIIFEYQVRREDKMHLVFLQYFFALLFNTNHNKVIYNTDVCSIMLTRGKYVKNVIFVSGQQWRRLVH